VPRPQATAYACDCQVTAELAGVLTALGTEHLRLLRGPSGGEPGRPQPATLPAVQGRYLGGPLQGMPDVVMLMDTREFTR